MSGLKINLKAAKEVSFEALPAGTYNATVFDVTMKETKGGGKLPEGTPMLNVQFRIADDEDYANRRVFKSYPIPPDDYPNKDALLNNIFTLSKALGWTDEEIRGWKALPELEEFAGRECRVTLKQREYNGEIQNDVSTVKPAGSDMAASSSGLSGL